MDKLTALSFSFLIFTIPYTANAQSANEEENVREAIEQLFEGMKSSDSAMVRQVFTADAILQTVATAKDGNTVIQQGNLPSFLNAIGSPKDEIWDEQISSYNIQTDAELASAWTPYKFFIGDEFSHCGVNSFQLVKTGEDWKIFHIVDTRRKTNCADK